MSLFVAAWRAFPAAPETSRLRNQRLHSMMSLIITAMLVAWSHVLSIIHPIAVLLIPAAGIHAFIVTGRYWIAKNRADDLYQTMLGAEAASEEPMV